MSENRDRGWRLLKSETLVLSGEDLRGFAVKHNALPQAPTEREMNPDRVKKLAEAMAFGRAIPFNWARVFFAAKEFRMNGQHSSRMIADFKGDLPQRIVIHLDVFEADNKEAMGDLFCQFDARWSSRSKGDVSGAYQGLVEQLSSVGRDKAKIAIEGVAWYKRNIEKVPVLSGDELYQMFFDASTHPFVKWVEEILSVKTPEMKRPPVLAAMYGTFCAAQSRSNDFWRAVALNNINDDSSPIAVLSAELVRSKESKTPFAPGEYYGKCIKAWNAFVEGEKIHSLNINTKKGLPDIAA